MRTYKRNYKHQKYDLAFVTVFLHEVRAGNSLHSVCKRYSVPYPTGYRWLNKNSLDKTISTRVGRPATISQEEEELLVVAIEYAAKCGFPFDRKDIVDIMKNFFLSSGRKNQFPNGEPGKDWLSSFIRRNKRRLAPRKPELLTKSRANALTEEVCEAFHEILEENVAKFNIAPDRIFNLDETGLTTDARCNKVLVPRSSRDSYMLAATCGKTSYSVLFCVSGTGIYLPPFVVYKGKTSLPSELRPPGCTFAFTKSGWMGDIVFEKCFEVFFRKIH